MEIIIPILLFILGLALIVKGGDWFVDAACWTAEITGIPQFIIGATIVSVATTLPELIVSVVAAAAGKNDMAIGNAIGSVTANSGLIMGISLACMPAFIKRKDYAVKGALLCGSILAVTLFSQGGSFGYIGSAFLFVLFAVFIWDNLRNGKKSDQPAEALAENGASVKEVVAVPRDKKTTFINIIKFLAGAAGIVIGADLLVDNGSKLALLMGISEALIAVTFVAVGTSLPELVTTITAIAKKQSSLSVGNIIGANIIDVCLIMPLCTLVSGKALPVSLQSMRLDMPVCLLISLVVVVPALMTKKLSRIQGFILLALYAVYITLLVCGVAG